MSLCQGRPLNQPAHNIAAAASLRAICAVVFLACLAAGRRSCSGIALVAGAGRPVQEVSAASSGWLHMATIMSCLLAAAAGKAHEQRRLARLERRIATLEGLRGGRRVASRLPFAGGVLLQRRGQEALQQDTPLLASAPIADVPLMGPQTVREKFPLVGGGGASERLCSFMALWEQERVRREQPLLQEFAFVPAAADSGVEMQEESDNGPGDRQQALAHDSYRFVVSKGLPNPGGEHATLHPPEPCCAFRAARRFGADRFLYVHGELQLCSPEAMDKEFEFCGRLWRPLFWRKEGQVVFFAVGPAQGGVEDLLRIPLENAMDELVPRAHNLEMSVLKYNQRLQLSFSAAQATCGFGFKELPDIMSTTGACLSDGCGLISPAAALQVQNSLGLQTLPCVFQGRAGPFKGLWAVDMRPKTWDASASNLPSVSQLLMRASQKKYSDPRAGAGATLEFEVLAHSHDSGPGSLNPELLQALASRGVPTDTFKSLLQEAQQDVQNLAEDEKKLQDYLSYPSTSTPVIRDLEQLFEAQMPWDEPHYAKLRLQCIVKQLQQIKERVRLPLRHSRRVMIVPDFTQQIPAGFCMLQLKPLESDIVSNRQVVLLRNPCYDDRCVLKLKVMDQPPTDLRHLQDVCVLSTAPDVSASPAETMGGDYDGDEVLVTWDTRIVDSVCDASLPSPGSTERAGQGCNVRLKDCLSKASSAMFVALAEVRKQHKRFTSACLERMAEVERGRGEFSERAYQLAAICAVGVDCHASGQAVPEYMESRDRPHWKLKKATGPFSPFTAKTVCGMIYDTCHPACDGISEETAFLDEGRLTLDRFPAEEVRCAIQEVSATLKQVIDGVEDVRARPFSRIFKQRAENRVLQHFQAVVESSSWDKALLGAAAYVVYAAQQGQVYALTEGSGAEGPAHRCRSPHEFERLLWRVFLPCICRAVADSRGAVARSVTKSRRQEMRTRRSRCRHE